MQAKALVEYRPGDRVQLWNCGKAYPAYWFGCHDEADAQGGQISTYANETSCLRSQNYESREYYGRINPVGGYVTEVKGTVRAGMVTIADIYDNGCIEGVVTGKVIDHTVHPLYKKKVAERVFESSVEVDFAGCVYQVRRSELKPQKQFFSPHRI